MDYLKFERMLTSQKRNENFALFIDTDINECASNPCYNGGTCNNNINYYSCSCKNGYTGTRCETGSDAHIFLSIFCAR